VKPRPNPVKATPLSAKRERSAVDAGVQLTNHSIAEIADALR